MIGLLAVKGQSAAFGNNEDDTLVMPYTTVQKKLNGISWLQNIAISAASAADMPERKSRSLAA